MDPATMVLPIISGILSVLPSVGIDPPPQTTTHTTTTLASSTSTTSSSSSTLIASSSSSITPAPSNQAAATSFSTTSSATPSATAVAATGAASSSGPTCNQTCIIISASVGGAVLIFLLIAIILCIRWRRRKAARSESRLAISAPLEAEAGREKEGPPVLNVLPATPITFSRISTFFSQPLAPVREEGRRPNRADYTDLETGSASGASSRDPSPSGRSVSEERPSRGMGWAK